MNSLAFDPTEPVTVTNELRITLVTRVTDGKTFEVANWLPTFTLGSIHTLRPQLRRASVRNKDGDQTYPIVCTGCGEPVVLKSLLDHGHYFSHLEKKDAELANCPYREDRQLPLDVLDRIRYHGQREGPRHRKTK